MGNPLRQVPHGGVCEGACTSSVLFCSEVSSVQPADSRMLNLKRLKSPARPNNRPMHLPELEQSLQIVFASHSNMGGPFVVGSHHLSARLAERGHRVAHVSMPISPLHVLRWKTGLRSRFSTYLRGGTWRAERLFEYVPFSFIPWQLVKAVPPLHGLVSVSLPSIASVLARAGFSHLDAMIVDAPLFAYLPALLRPRTLIYRATDLYQEMTADSWIAKAERSLATRADLMIGTSEPVTARLREFAPATRVLLMENGVEINHFQQHTTQPPEYVDHKKKRAVYVGALDERLAFDVLLASAQALPDVDFIVIGPIEGEAARKASKTKNLHLLGQRAYSVLPQYLQHATLALLPLSSHPANRGRSPMKLYEYAAGGLPVVATETQELRRRNLPFALMAGSTDEFVGNIRRLLADEELYSSLKVLARQAASEHSWLEIAKRFEDEILRLCGR